MIDDTLDQIKNLKWEGPSQQIISCKKIVYDIDAKKELNISYETKLKLIHAKKYCEYTINLFESANRLSSIDPLRLYNNKDISNTIMEVEDYLTLVENLPIKMSESIRIMTWDWTQEELLRKGFLPLKLGLKAQLELLKYQLSIQKSLWLNYDGTIYIENEKIREKYNSLAENVQKSFWNK